MKVFALINENNVVTNISIAEDNWDSTGWLDCTNKDCSIGFTYDEVENIFIAPKPYASWIRSGSFWIAPTPEPTDNKLHTWDEDLLTWIGVEK